MSKGLITVLVVVAIVVLIGFVVFGQYVGVRNTLVTKNEAVKAAWSQVDIVLQRRADLIPNLVETVKGFAQQEQTVFGDIAKARSALLSAGTPSEKIAANQQLDGALGRLLVVWKIILSCDRTKTSCIYRMNSPVLKTALQSSASVTTTRFRITTLTFNNSPPVFLPDGRASRSMMLILQHPKRPVRHRR